MTTSEKPGEESTSLDNSIQALLFPSQASAEYLSLQPGEHYAGLVLDPVTGQPSHHLILLPARHENVSWEEAGRLTESIWGGLPTLQELSLLHTNLRRCFGDEWYWSSERHETEKPNAWAHSFMTGHQFVEFRGYTGCACAVRKRLIQPQP